MRAPALMDKIVCFRIETACTNRGAETATFTAGSGQRRRSDARSVDQGLNPHHTPYSPRRDANRSCSASSAA